MKAKKSNKKENTLSSELLKKINAYRRATTYLPIRQLYLHQYPLLHESLKLENIKKMLLGHWGTTPGQNLIYAHLDRVIKKYDLDMFTSPNLRRRYCACSGQIFT